MFERKKTKSTLGWYYWTVLLWHADGKRCTIKSSLSAKKHCICIANIFSVITEKPRNLDNDHVNLAVPCSKMERYSTALTTKSRAMQRRAQILIDLSNSSLILE